KEPESETVKILEATDEVLRKAKNQLYKISLDKDSIARYREIEKRMYDEISALDYAEKKGEKKGELKTKKLIAINLLSKGTSLKEISQIIELDESEINKLINED
ncbi:MAG: hypothetical protein E6929_19075, partial [Clostridium sp.]|nr:hypothetical protein [Clostridium sp.]